MRDTRRIEDRVDALEDAVLPEDGDDLADPGDLYMETLRFSTEAKKAHHDGRQGDAEAAEERAREAWQQYCQRMEASPRELTYDSEYDGGRAIHEDKPH